MAKGKGRFIGLRINGKEIPGAYMKEEDFNIVGVAAPGYTLNIKMPIPEPIKVDHIVLNGITFIRVGSR